jgi:hypothetical protein
MTIIFYLLYFIPFLLLFISSKIHIKYNIFKISVTNTLLLFYLISNHIGLAIIYHNGYIRSGEISANKETLILLALYNNIVVLFWFFTKVIFKIQEIKFVTKKKYNLNYTTFILILPIILFFAFAKFNDASPLQSFISGDVIGAANERLSQVTENRVQTFGIKNSYINIFFEIATFIILMLFLDIYKYGKNYLNISFLFLFLFCIILFSSSNLSKGSMLSIFYFAYFTYVTINNNGFLLYKKGLFVILPSIFIIAIITSILMGNEKTDFIYPITRLILGNLEPQYIIVNQYNFSNLLYGTSFSSFLSFGIHKQIDISTQAWHLLGLDLGTMNLEYTAPFSFVGEAHVNFHFIGVIFFSFSIFSILNILEYYIYNLKNHIKECLIIYITLHFSYMSVVGLNSFIIDYYLWGVIIYIFLYNSFKIKELIYRYRLNLFYDRNS